MIRRLKTKLRDFCQYLRMTEYERFLSQSTDMVDLEYRMKYGSRPKNHMLNDFYHMRGF